MLVRALERLGIARLGFEHLPGTSCCVPEQDAEYSHIALVIYLDNRHF